MSDELSVDVSDDPPKQEKRSTLASAVVVVFDAADTSRLDTPTVDPVTPFLRFFPTASETAPD